MLSSLRHGQGAVRPATTSHAQVFCQVQAQAWPMHCRLSRPHAALSCSHTSTTAQQPQLPAQPPDKPAGLQARTRAAFSCREDARAQLCPALGKCFGAFGCRSRKQHAVCSWQMRSRQPASRCPCKPRRACCARMCCNGTWTCACCSRAACPCCQQYAPGENRQNPQMGQSGTAAWAVSASTAVHKASRPWAMHRPETWTCACCSRAACPCCQRGAPRVCCDVQVSWCAES